MALDWLERDNVLKDHNLFDDRFNRAEAPSTIYEKAPLLDPKGNAVEGLYTARITLNNPAQYNSYTTDMVKGVIAGFHKASMDKSIVAAVFTGVGDRAFCTGGNTKEYAEYYTRRPKDYSDYIYLFGAMVDAILSCGVPTICRVNGMRIGGGQEIGQACDINISADTAVFGQVGTRAGSSPDGGSTDFLPWNLSMEHALWNCVSNIPYSSYKMERLGLIGKALPVKKDKDGNWVRDPRVITDKYVDNGEIVYGEMKSGAALKEGNDYLKTLATDFTLLDNHINGMIWTLTNTFPMCLMKAVETIRLKKRFFWDTTKTHARYWLGANMNGDAWMGFNAFNTQAKTGSSTVDFLELRRQISLGHIYGEELAEKVLAKPKK
ncbi:MAG: 6-oxocyclohex-1-ene-1-carbonyl-CoA hydratase [Syntrophales bacterium]|jgi:6-oxo-cyclohex-1-ene-carbonyl-CoA hydrolase|nr:6-oxocyclohex-1-ene-1-carbonyl-CoA hydratase [Syntrophales bacterium]NLN59137.1 6-oxocyclohex-1-ene-1-carbonyl-CoA hydratase [Deltaproteobacteria bacterium]